MAVKQRGDSSPAEGHPPGGIWAARARFGTVVLLQVVAVALTVYLISSGRRRDVQGRHQTASVHRHRVDGYIARVGREDLETLVQNLSEHEDLLVLPFVGGVADQLMFHTCLANRRLAKLFAELQAQPPEDAARLAKEIFERKFSPHRSAVLELAKAWEEGSQPARALEGLDDNMTALYGAIFLSAEFCSVSEVLGQVDRWTQLGEAAQARVERTTAHPRSRLLASITVEEYGFPEDLFLLNIYTWMLRDRCGDGEFERLLPQGLRCEEVAFCAWDARTNPFDPTHLLEGQPLDQRRVLRWLKYYPAWDTWPHAPFAKQRNRQLLAVLRQRLQRCVADGVGGR